VPRGRVGVRFSKKNVVATQLYLPFKTNEELADIADELGLSKNSVVTISVLSLVEHYIEGSISLSTMKQPIGTNDTRIQVALPEEAKVSLTIVAKRQKVKINWLCNLAIYAFIENYRLKRNKIFYDVLH